MSRNFSQKFLLNVKIFLWAGKREEKWAHAQEIVLEFKEQINPQNAAGLCRSMSDKPLLVLLNHQSGHHSPSCIICNLFSRRRSQPPNQRPGIALKSSDQQR
jgi:hypothetical protein